MSTTPINDQITYTPGPWREGKNGASIVADTRVAGAPDPYEAECLEYYGGHVIAESIAPCNRPIIMAAPETLQALKGGYLAITQAIEIAEHVGARAVVLNYDTAKMLEFAARQAIAKAEGRQ